MSIYMADRDLPGITLEQLAAAQRAAIDTSQRFSAAGKSVRYIRSTWVPGDSRVMCLFEADDAGLVEEVNRTAGIPFSRVVEARDLTPSS
jgi:muconolactone delta-isomerase